MNLGYLLKECSHLFVSLESYETNWQPWLQSFFLSRLTFNSSTEGWKKVNSDRNEKNNKPKIFESRKIERNAMNNSSNPQKAIILINSIFKI